MKTFLTNYKHSAFILMVSLCAAITGCSSKASEVDGKKAVQNQITQDAQGRITLIGFHKTNGQEAEVNGVKLYSMEFEAEIEFSEACRWLQDGSYQRNPTFRTAAKPSSNRTQTLALLDHISTGDSSLMEKGQRAKIVGTIAFMKKENGWSVVKVNLASATLIASSTSPAAEVQQALPSSTAVTDVSQVPPQSGQQKTDQKLIDELRQIKKDLMDIEVAKTDWALDKGKRNGAIPTEADLKPYFAGKEFPVHPSNGSYIINTALDKKVESSKYGNTDVIDEKFHDQLFPKPHFDFEKMTSDQIQKLVKNDLIVINSAKNQWGLEKTNDDIQKNIFKGKDWLHATPIEDDLKPYFWGGYFPEHPPGGHFIINPVGQPAESSTYGQLR